MLAHGVVCIEDTYKIQKDEPADSKTKCFRICPHVHVADFANILSYQ